MKIRDLCLTKALIAVVLVADARSLAVSFAGGFGPSAWF